LRNLTRAVALLGLLALSRLSSAAEGINLFWNDCGAGLRPATNREFACDVNTGSNLLVASFWYSTYVQYQLGSMTVDIDLQSAGATLPAWWGLAQTGMCRSSCLTPVRDLSPVSCVDPWLGYDAHPVFLYQTTRDNPSMPPNRAHIYANTATHHSEMFLDPNGENVAFALRLNNSLTIGSGACEGCSVPVCLVLNSITLANYWHEYPSIYLTAPFENNYVTWQGGAIGGAGCPGATPTLNRTWGQIKTLYR